MDRGSLNWLGSNLEGNLEGENLEFYRNIRDLKILTVNARALLARSNTIFKDILENRELKTVVTGKDEVTVESDSLNNLAPSQCRKCGLVHGIQGYCVLDEIIQAEKLAWGSPKPSPPLLSFERVPRKSQMHKKLPPLQQQPNLLYREIPTEELEIEYSKICYRYGRVNGEKFLRARSLAVEVPKKERLKHEQDYCTPSVMRECVPGEETSLPHKSCSVDWHNQMAALMEPVADCMFESPKFEKDWKRVFKVKPQSKKVKLAAVDGYVGFSPGTSHVDSNSVLTMCSCGLDGCDCVSQSYCKQPQKHCILVEDHQNNYLYTVRHRLKNLEFAEGKASLNECTLLSKNSVKMDSKIMMKKAYESQKRHIKTCLSSTIENEGSNLDVNLNKPAQLTDFTAPDAQTWNRWIKGFVAQNHTDEDLIVESVSGDSTVASSSGSSSNGTSTTENELKHQSCLFSYIPYAKETKNLGDYLFDVVNAKFLKSIKKSNISNISDGYNGAGILNFGRFDDSINLVEKLTRNPHFFKSFRPNKVSLFEKQKRYTTNNRKLRKKIRRRNYILGVQQGKCYRLRRRSFDSTKEREYCGFKRRHRKLLQDPKSNRFGKCDIVNDTLLSKENIRSQYTLLRLLFDKPKQIPDKERSMDIGMIGLKNSKKPFQNKSVYHFESNSNSKVGGGATLNVDVSFTRKPLKEEELMLKNSKPGVFQSSSPSIQPDGLVTSRQIHRARNSCCSTSANKQSIAPCRASSSNHKHARWGANISELSKAKKVSRNLMSNEAESSDHKLLLEQCLQPPEALPIPPLSESSCEELEVEATQRQFPLKEEAQRERSARTKIGKISFCRNYEGERDEVLTDQSSGSYNPPLLNIHKSRAHQRSAYFKSAEGRRRMSHTSESSTDGSDPIDTGKDTCSKHSAWNRKSGFYDHRTVAPYLAEPSKAADECLIGKFSKHLHGLKSNLSPPKPGPSNIRSSFLSKAPSNSTHSNTQLEKDCEKSALVDSPRCRTRASKNHIRANIVTEQLLRDSLPNDVANDIPSSKKISVESRATPVEFPRSSVQVRTSSKNLSVAPLSELPFVDDRALNYLLNPAKSQGEHQIQSPAEASGNLEGSNQSSKSSFVRTSSKQLIKRASEVAGNVFRHRSSVSPDQGLKQETKTQKLIVKEAPQPPSTPSSSSSSMKIKRLEAIRPTKKRYFELDIGQGINCITYLKQNAPGADEKQRKELVNLLVDPLEMIIPKRKTNDTVEEEGTRVHTPLALESLKSSSEQSSQSGIQSDRFEKKIKARQITHDAAPSKKNFKTLDQIYKETHGISQFNTPKSLIENDYEFELKRKQQLTKHKIFP